MTRVESLTPQTARTNRTLMLATAAVVLCLLALIVVLWIVLRQTRENLTSTVSLRREATRLAIDRGVTLCRAGQVPSGLLWLGRSLELAPPDDAEFQRIIRTNITAWTDRACSSVDILKHGASVQTVACSSDGSTLATAGVDGKICIWKMPKDATTPGSQVASFSVGDPPNAYAFDSTGRTLVTGSDDGTIRFFDINSRKQKKLVINQAGSVSSVAISSDGTFLVTGSTAGIVRRWDAKTGKLLGELAGHTDWVLSVAISPDGQYFLSGGNDYKAQLWRTESTAPAGPAIDLGSAVTGVAFSPDATRFMTVAGYNATIFFTANMEPDGEPIRHDSALRSAAFDPAGTSVVTGCRDGFIRIWDLKTRAEAAPSIRCVTSVHLVNFAPAGRTIISADDFPGVRIWRLPAGDNPFMFINTGLAVTALAFTPDGSRIVVGTSAAGDPGLPSDNGWARIYRVDNGLPDSPQFATGVGVISAAISEDGKLLLTGGSNNFLRLRSLPNLKPFGEPLHYGNRLRAVALVAKLKTILASGTDAGSQGDVKIWKYDTAPRANQWPAIIDQDQAVVSMGLSPDQTRVATASGTGSASVWTIADAQPAGVSFLPSKRGHGRGLSPRCQSDPER